MVETYQQQKLVHPVLNEQNSCTEEIDERVEWRVKDRY
jgi:hypothetical protein